MIHQNHPYHVISFLDVILHQLYLAQQQNALYWSYNICQQLHVKDLGVFHFRWLKELDG